MKRTCCVCGRRAEDVTPENGMRCAEQKGQPRKSCYVKIGGHGAKVGKRWLARFMPS